MEKLHSSSKYMRTLAAVLYAGALGIAATHPSGAKSESAKDIVYSHFQTRGGVTLMSGRSPSEAISYLSRIDWDKNTSLPRLRTVYDMESQGGFAGVAISPTDPNNMAAVGVDSNNTFSNILLTSSNGGLNWIPEWRDGASYGDVSISTDNKLKVINPYGIDTYGNASLDIKTSDGQFTQMSMTFRNTFPLQITSFAPQADGSYSGYELLSKGLRRLDVKANTLTITDNSQYSGNAIVELPDANNGRYLWLIDNNNANALPPNPPSKYGVSNVGTIRVYDKESKQFVDAYQPQIGLHEAPPTPGYPYTRIAIGSADYDPQSGRALIGVNTLECGDTRGLNCISFPSSETFIPGKPDSHQLLVATSEYPDRGQIVHTAFVRLSSQDLEAVQIINSQTNPPVSNILYTNLSYISNTAWGEVRRMGFQTFIPSVSRSPMN